MKIKFDSDDELPLKLYNMVIVVVRETNTIRCFLDNVCMN